MTCGQRCTCTGSPAAGGRLSKGACLRIGEISQLVREEGEVVAQEEEEKQQQQQQQQQQRQRQEQEQKQKQKEQRRLISFESADEEQQRWRQTPAATNSCGRVVFT